MGAADALNSLDFGGSDEGYGAEDENELLVLQKVVQQTLEKKKQAAARKQAALLEEVRAGMQKRVAAMDAVINKEVKDATSLSKATITKTNQRLQEKISAMDALTVKYQQDMAVLWEQYDEEHSSLGNSVEQIRMACENRKQGMKRRIAALAQENEAALAEARKKVELEKGRAVKMPQLAKLLQSLM